MRQLILTSLIPLLIGGTVRGQKLLTPSISAFENKWIKSGSYQMKWYMLRDTAKMEIGEVYTEIIADKQTLTVVTRVNMKNMNSAWVDSTINDRSTLKPIRHTSSNMQRDILLNFGQPVTGSYTEHAKGKQILVSDTVSGSYFDSNLYPQLIGWLPMSDGYRQDIAIYDFNPGGKSGRLTVSVKDVRSDTYQTDKQGPRAVWAVDVTDEINGGTNNLVTYYFDKTDRKLWKQEINSNGRKMLMKRVE
jgi:hypothetical protein